MRIVRASEIGEYIYCHRAWWLHQIQGLESANRAEMQAGVTRHQQHGRAVQRAAGMQQAAIIFAGMAFLIALIAIIFSS